MSRLPETLTAALLATAFALPAAAQPLGLGRAALPEEIAAWDVAVLPDGQGLRPGSGNVLDGEEVYIEMCAVCHGDFAEGIDNWPVLAGGGGTLADDRPVKTIGSYWPYLSTVWDYVHRSMPFGTAQTVTVDDTYAITAYLLYSNNMVDDDFVLTHENFTEVVMPNADGFYIDDRAETEYPLFTAEPCMTDCAASVEITRRAVDLGVTPMEDGRPAGTLPPLTLASADTAGAAEAEAEAEPAAEAEAEPEPEATAAADHDPELVAKGQRVFRQCAACHQVGDTARNTTGPQLNGVYGAPAGQVEGFRYSNPMTTAGKDGLVWTDTELHAYLESPRAYMRGNRMAFNGLRSEDDRAAVIAYLATFAD